MTLSFSGAGHLLPYHLGVSLAFLEHIHQTETHKRIPKKQKKHSLSSITSSSSLSSSSSNLNSSSTTPKSIPPIKAVAGSSSGAIAAVVFTKLPQRIEEYAEQFIQTRGKALEILSSMLLDEERHLSGILYNGGPASLSSSHQHQHSTVSIDQRKRNNIPNLYVATTKCNDGSTHLFRYNTNEMFSTISSSWNTDSILQAVKASCTIPSSFHPIDLLPGLFMDKISYPDQEGILIDGQYYVDGGISSPVPSIPKLNETTKQIVVSPISYGENVNSQQDFHRISPSDNSWRLLPLQNVQFRNGFFVKPSMQNIRALRVAGGIASSDELRDWYELGIEDGNKAIETWK